MKRLLAVLLCAPLLAWAQSFPSRAVSIVVPYPPGGLIDIVARVLAPALAKDLGQPVLVENRSGAGGNVGADFVAKSAPDGYTMVLVNPSFGISPHIYAKLNYHTLNDFAFIGLYGTVPNVLVVHPSIPAKSVPELIKHLKANPGRLNYASPGYGTSPQMSMELFKSMTGTFIVHIPFRGSGPAQVAMLANETQLMFDNLPPQVPRARGDQPHSQQGDAGAANPRRARPQGLRGHGLVRPRRARENAARGGQPAEPGAQPRDRHRRGAQHDGGARRGAFPGNARAVSRLRKSRNR